MYRINHIPIAITLQPCCSEADFFQVLHEVDLTALEAIISESTAAAGQGCRNTPLAGDDMPDGEILQSDNGNKRRGRKVMPAGPFVRLRLYCLYPGTGAPPQLETMRKRLKRHGNNLATRLGFTDGVPDRKTFRERFKRLDAHLELIIEALRALSPRGVQLSLFPTDPEPLPEQKERRVRNRTQECNDTRNRLVQDTVGDDEFDAMTPRGNGADDLVVLHVHGGNVTCHNCRPGECKKGHDHGLTERPPRELKCPNPARHDAKCVHEVRREWRCRCCGSNVSATSGIKGLNNSKLPLRVVLRCIHIMLRERDGVAALQMAGNLNIRGRTMRHGTILRLMHIIRGAMNERHPLPFKSTVEIDEAKVALKDSVVHLIGAYDHATRRVYIEIMDRPANQQVMRDFAERVSLPGSLVYTDGTAAWPPDIDRKHGVVIHKNFEFGRRAELEGEGQGWFYITTNRIEGKWARVRRSLRVPTAVTSKYFPLYLDEGMWRINYLGNRLEAERHQGGERRGAALIGQILNNMGRQRLNSRQLLGDEEENSTRAASVPVSSHASPSSDNGTSDASEMPLAA